VYGAIELRACTKVGWFELTAGCFPAATAAATLGTARERKGLYAFSLCARLRSYAYPHSIYATGAVLADALTTPFSSRTRPPREAACIARCSRTRTVACIQPTGSSCTTVCVAIGPSNATVHAAAASAAAHCAPSRHSSFVRAALHTELLWL